MDAPISISLAHLIIIWTLSILLFAWMLTFAILAVRSRTSSADETVRTQESSRATKPVNAVNATPTATIPHTTVAMTPAVVHSTLRAHSEEAMTFQTYQAKVQQADNGVKAPSAV